MLLESMRNQMAKTIRYVKPIPYNVATGYTAEIYHQMQLEFLPVPPLTLHSPAPMIMAGVWSVLRETLLVGQADRALKEAVASAISKSNQCPYCVDIHTTMLHATGQHKTAGAILQGQYQNIQDTQIGAAIQWVFDNKQNRKPTGEVPFSLEFAPEMIGTVVIFEFINRMVNVFLGEAVVPIPSNLKGLTGRLFSATVGQRFVDSSLNAGESLKFIPQTSLSEDLYWAASNPVIGHAFAGFVAVVEEAGKSVFSEDVRILISDTVQKWEGGSPGMSVAWVDKGITVLNENDRDAARLGILTAVASYQVGPKDIDRFRSNYKDDAQLIAATAWASLTAARRIGQRFAESLRIKK